MTIYTIFIDNELKTVTVVTWIGLRPKDENTIVFEKFTDACNEAKRIAEALQYEALYF